MGATVPAVDLSVVDEWQEINAEIRAPVARNFWILPIETVSESEEGFERIYQGSQVIAVWPVELVPRAPNEGANGPSLRAFAKSAQHPLRRREGCP